VIRLEETTARCVRVIGTLSRAELGLLTETLARGVVVLDVSQLDQADESAVRWLAGLQPDRCTLAGCPPWLALWVERVRAAGPEGGAPRR
jgi:anti-anti-sigma regulatory factor